MPIYMLIQIPQYRLTFRNQPTRCYHTPPDSTILVNHMRYSMDKTQSLKRAFYFKKCNQNDKITLIDEYKAEIQSQGGTDNNSVYSSIYKRYKEKIRLNYRNDFYKILLFVLSCLITCCSIICLFALSFESIDFLFSIFLLCACVLHMVTIGMLCFGFVHKKIQISEYKYHVIAFAVHISLTIVVVTIVCYNLYRLADILSGF